MLTHSPPPTTDILHIMQYLALESSGDVEVLETANLWGTIHNGGDMLASHCGSDATISHPSVMPVWGPGTPERPGSLKGTLQS